MSIKLYEMKKTCLNIMALIALMVFFSSCEKVILDAGDLTEEVRDFDQDFTKIHISGSLDLLVNQDDSGDQVRIEAGEKLLEHIETFVQDGTLFIEEETNNFLTSGVRRIFVTKELLDEVTMIGSGDLEADGIICESFNLKMEGSGDSDVEFSAVEDLNISMDGSGDCEMKGEGNSITLGLNGSGDCNARFLEVNSANVNINGSGDVEVYASNEITVNINGSGDVDIWGNPENKLFNINGSGDITEHE